MIFKSLNIVILVAWYFLHIFSFVFPLKEGGTGTTTSHYVLPSIPKKSGGGREVRTKDVARGLKYFGRAII